MIFVGCLVSKTNKAHISTNTEGANQLKECSTGWFRMKCVRNARCTCTFVTDT